MNECLTFNGISFSDFHTYYDPSKAFPMPKKDVNTYSIPGRSGNVSVSNERYENITIPYYCYIPDNFYKNYTALMNYLLTQDGYGRLETSVEPDVYRLALFLGDIDPRLGLRFHFGDFTLNFDCKPQKWLKSGEIAIPINSTKKLINPTSQKAYPLIKVTGTGSITINDSVLTLANNTSTTIIDCEIQDAYEGTINRNSDLTVVNGFPVLAEENTITVSGCTIDLIPRWWRL